MAEVVDLALERKMKMVDDLIAAAQKRYGGLPDFDVTSLEEVEIIAFLALDESGEVVNLNFLFCDGGEKNRHAVGMLRLSPEQWDALKQAGVHLEAGLTVANS